MPTVLASTRIATEQKEVEEIGRRLEELEDELKKALVADDEPAVARLDNEIAKLKRQREHHQLRIDTLFAQQALEQKATAAKQRAQLVSRIEAKIDELRETVVAFQKKQAQAIELHRKWQDIAMQLAASWAWGPSHQNACGFHLDEITRDTKHELCRIGSGQLLHAGALQRPSFPGGHNPRLDWLHDPGRITPLIETVDQRLALAKRVLRASIEPMEKAS
jgi:hypothetical protein